jgi:hypothetical protein
MSLISPAIAAIASIRCIASIKIGDFAMFAGS